jgi:hypothetical protein
MGAQVTRNGKSYYKADDGKLYQNYAAAVKAAPKAKAAKKGAEQAVIEKGRQQVQEDNSFGGMIKNWNPVEAVLGAALNNPVARGARGVIRMAGEALGQGDAMDAMDNAVRGVTGDRSKVNPSSYSGSGRTQLANSIDAAYKRGASPNKSGYIPVGYSDYDNKKSSLITGAMMARKNDDGSYEISPDERYDFNASHATDRESYKKNLDGAMSAAIEDRNVLGVLANAPDYLNYYTGAGGRGMNIGGKFQRPGETTPDSPNYTPKPTNSSNYAPNSSTTTKSTAPSSAPASSSYQVQVGDTLTSISRKSGVSIADLAKKNNIQNLDQLSIGQSISY